MASPVSLRSADVEKPWPGWMTRASPCPAWLCLVPRSGAGPCSPWTWAVQGCGMWLWVPVKAWDDGGMPCDFCHRRWGDGKAEGTGGMVHENLYLEMFGAPFEARFATRKVLLVFTSHVFLCNIRRTAQRCPSTRASAPVKRVVPGKAVCSCCR